MRVWKANMDIKKGGIHLFTLLATMADLHPENIFFTFNGNSYTYRQVLSCAQRCAHAFTRLGVKNGDRVILQCGNNPWFVFSFFGLMQTGAIAVLVNPAARIYEMSYYTRESNASLLITDGKSADCFSENPELFSKAPLVTIREKPGYESIESIVSHENQLYVQLENHGEDTAIIIFTSAMDGYALGAMLSHNNLTISAAVASELFEDNGGKFVAVLPMYHAFGLTTSLIMPLINSREILLIPRFSPKKIVSVLSQPDTGFITAVPAIYSILQNIIPPDKDFSHVTMWVSGGDFLPISLQQWFHEKAGIIIRQGYGLTEASPIVTWNIPDREPRPGSIGREMPYNTMKVQENGNICMPGETGEFMIKGLNVTSGYFNRPDKTAITLQDGWLRSGDTGYMDDDGYFYITGRKKDMILRNGFNVYPAEVARILTYHPSAKDVRVSGHFELTNDASSRESLHATIITAKNASLTEENIKKWCSENISSYKIPDTFHIHS